MSEIIEIDFKKQENKDTALAFANSRIFTDARVYAHYLFDLLEEINSHFWNNYQRAGLKIDQGDVYQFENFLRQAKLYIGDTLIYLYDTEDNTTAYQMLKFEYDKNFKVLFDWLKTMDIEYRQANIINIKNFIGVHN